MKRTLAIIAVLMSLGLRCAAGPNPDTLKSFKVFVPDYSKTCGGLSPAISEGGGDLFFYSREYNNPFGDLLSLAPGLISEGTTVDPKKVQIQYGPDAQYVPNEEVRNIDWSRDGNSLAFVGRDGFLYVAQIYDPVTGRYTEPKPKKLVAYDSGQVCSPRWSPDGTHIAYAVISRSQSNCICVVEAASGKQAVLADDGTLDRFVWEQPWSPDGKRIVYGGCPPGGELGINLSVTFNSSSAAQGGKSNQGNAAYLVVVPIDGGGRTVLRGNGAALSPSWSPKGDRIAFASTRTDTCKLAEGNYVNYSTMSIWTCDSSGKDLKILTHSNYQMNALARQYHELFLKSAARGFEKEYGPKLSREQLAKLRSGKMSVAEMCKIAKVIPSDTKTKQNLNGPSELKSPSNGANSKGADKTAPAFMLEALVDTVKGGFPRIVRMEVSPVWSEDGTKLAFIRGFITDECDWELIVHDLGTGTEKLLVDHEGIQSVSWFKGGKELIGQFRRPMSHEEDGLEIKSQPGYPEIWMLEPK